MGYQNVIITGTSSGFGLGCALDLAEKGHRVHATMRNVSSANKAAAERLRSFASEHDVRLSVHELDTSSDESVQVSMERIIEEAGHVDVLLNNAGVMPLGITEAFASSQLTSCLNTNVVGYFRTMKAVLPTMRARGSGLIINISSISGRIAFPYEGVYNASKFAVEGLSEALRYELSSTGIDVVIVEPGPLDTMLVKNSPSPQEVNIVADYGDTPTSIVQTIEESFVKLVSEENLSTDPALLVKAINEIIETPVGDRPLRVTVGPDLHVGSLNDASAPHQAAVMKALHVDHLASVRTAK